MAELGAMPSAWKHTVEKLDATLEHLHHAGEVFLPVAHAYGNHCAKAAWTVAFVSLQQAGYGHVDALSARSVPVASVAGIAFGFKQV